MACGEKMLHCEKSYFVHEADAGCKVGDTVNYDGLLYEVVGIDYNHSVTFHIPPDHVLLITKPVG